MKTISNCVPPVWEDGWIKLMAYGDYPHPSGFIQRLNKEVANDLVARTKSLRFRLGKWLKGWPVYKGHPDIQRIFYPDAEPKGSIIDMMCDDVGLYCRVQLLESGEELVKNGLKYLSACWDGLVEGGYYIPKRLLSVGLTSNPVIRSGESLANSMGDDLLFAFYSLKLKKSVTERLYGVEDYKARERIILEALREK